MTTYVLDSSAVICLLRNEDGADVVENLPTDPANNHFLHAINWVEVRYLEQRGRTPPSPPFSEFLATFGVTVSSELSRSFLEQVVSLKAKFPPIALGDCFAVALAQNLHAALVTTDRGELERIAEAGECQILFVR